MSLHPNQKDDNIERGYEVVLDDVLENLTPPRSDVSRVVFVSETSFLRDVNNSPDAPNLTSATPPQWPSFQRHDLVIVIANGSIGSNVHLTSSFDQYRRPILRLHLDTNGSRPQARYTPRI